MGGYIILLGPPGSGKGTHGALLAKKLHLMHISIGDIFRVMAETKDEEASLINSYMAEGKLIPTAIVNKIVKKFLLRKEYENGCVLDGYPRNLEQAEFLETIKKQDIKVIYFDVNDQIIIKRILGRFTCENCGEIYNSYFVKPKVENVCDICGSDKFVNRKDDNEQTIKKRLEEYKTETYPLINYYKHHAKVYNVDASKDKHEVEQDLSEIVKMI